MTTKIKAPEIPNPSYPSGGYPTKGRKIGPAWEDAWRVLVKAGTEYVDGKELADKVAPKHDLSPQTLAAILSRAERAGLLLKVMRPVATTVTRSTSTGKTSVTNGTRTRVHYRINPDTHRG